MKKLILLVLVCMFLISFASAATRFYNGGDSTSASVNSLGGQNFTAYNFTSNYTGAITTVQAYLIQGVATANHDRSVGIFTGVDEPTTQIGGWSEEVVLDGVNGKYINWSWNGGNPSLTSGTNYWLVFNLTTPTVSGYLRFGETGGEPNVYFVSPDDWGNWQPFAGNVQSMNIKLWSSSVTLDFPENAAIRVTTPVLFNSTYDSGDASKNATLYLWNSTGLISKTVNTTFTADNNRSTFSVTPGFASNIWNVYWCGENATGTTCTFAASNRTLTYGYNITGDVYSATSLTGTSEKYSSAVTFASAYTPSIAWFSYNGTNTLGSITSLGSNQYTFNITKDTPGTAGNYAHNWIITVTDGVDTFGFNTTTRTQTVGNILVDDCGTYKSVLFNFTNYDEDSRTILKYPYYNNSINLAIKIGNPSLTIYSSYAFNKSNINSAAVCANESLSNYYGVDLTVQYSSTDHVTEYFNIQNYTYNQFNRNITLYDLLTTSSQEFLLNIKDENYIPLQDALVEIQRYYVQTGGFDIVEIPKTDTLGKTIAHLVSNSATYNIYLWRGGQLLGAFTNVQAYCDSGSTDCQINLNVQGSNVVVDNFISDEGIYYVTAYNDTTRTFSITYTGTDSTITKTVSLTGVLNSAYLNQTVCTGSLTAYAGTVNCAVPSTYQNNTVWFTGYSDGTELFTTPVYVGYASKSSILFKGRTIFAALLFVPLFALIMIGSPAMALIGMLLGVVASIGLDLVDGLSFFGVGSAFVWLVIGTLIIIFKISRSQNG